MYPFSSTYNPTKMRMAVMLNTAIILTTAVSFVATIWLGRLMVSELLQANAPFDKVIALAVATSLLVLLTILAAALYLIETVLMRYGQTVGSSDLGDRLKDWRKDCGWAMLIVVMLFMIYMVPAT